MAPHWKDNVGSETHKKQGLRMHPKGFRGQCLRLTLTNFLFVLVQSTEIPGDISGYTTAPKYNKIFSTITYFVQL